MEGEPIRFYFSDGPYTPLEVPEKPTYVIAGTDGSSMICSRCAAKINNDYRAANQHSKFHERLGF